MKDCNVRFKKGQRWRSKDSGVILTLINKINGGKWSTKTNHGNNHAVWERTLLKFYYQIERGENG